MNTLIIKSENPFSAQLLAEVAKKMKMKAKVMSDEEMEDAVLGKLIDEAVNSDEQDISEEEGLKLLRQYGYKF